MEPTQKPSNMLDLLIQASKEQRASGLSPEAYWTQFWEKSRELTEGASWEVIKFCAAQQAMRESDELLERAREAWINGPQ